MDGHTRQIAEYYWLHTSITINTFFKDQTRMEDHTRPISDITGFIY